MTPEQTEKLIAMMDTDEFWQGFEERYAESQAKEAAELQAFKDSGKMEVVLKWIREYFANPETKWKHMWDETIAYFGKERGCDFDHNDFRHTLDVLIENVEREEIEDACFETTMWTTDEFVVELVYGQGALYGIMARSEKEDRIKHITSWDDEE